MLAGGLLVICYLLFRMSYCLSNDKVTDVQYVCVCFAQVVFERDKLNQPQMYRFYVTADVLRLLCYILKMILNKFCANNLHKRQRKVCLLLFQTSLTQFVTAEQMSTLIISLSYTTYRNKTRQIFSYHKYNYNDNKICRAI